MILPGHSRVDCASSERCHDECSGMLPGYVAGVYSHDQCHIDLAQLATFAKARLVHDTCVSIDPGRNQIGFQTRPSLTYDCLSVDIGITPDLQSTPGMEHVTPVKPIDGCACQIFFCAHMNLTQAWKLHSHWSVHSLETHDSSIFRLCLCAYVGYSSFVDYCRFLEPGSCIPSRCGYAGVLRSIWQLMLSSCLHSLL